MSTTRFEPSLTGGIHLGHLYAAILNERIAHSTGGKFIVRFDDNGYNMLPLKDRIENMGEQVLFDLQWMGIVADEVEYNSILGGKADKVLEEAGIAVPPEQEFIAFAQPSPIWLGQPDALVYPYTPRLTARKVVLDYFAGINLLIRGEELMTEVSLYCYYCDLLGYPKPEFVYIPRLRHDGGEISKTLGNYKIALMRANGYSPQMVWDKLATACLKNQANGWTLLNLKASPCL